MRIGCLQFAPKVGEVPKNITRADAVLSKADPSDRENLDLLVLPEMAFSGYNFKSREHILPYLEPTGSGASSQWARTTARKYNCTVAVGYPEKTEIAGGEPEYYNSLVVIDSNGEKLADYSKSFLYYTDATWAHEGRGFYGGVLGSLGQTALGICMDINPYKFEAPWDAYEFAFHVLHVRANLVILSTAWLTNDEQSAFLSCPGAPDLSTLAYWVARLEPVIRAHSSEETIVVFANRCGAEDEATYAGTSAVIGIKDGEVSVYGVLGRGVEELLVVDTEKPPFGKLVNRPATPAAGEPGSPPAPPSPAEEDDPDDGPSKGAGRGAAGAGYVDSPTLPSGFAPPASSNRTTHRAAAPPSRPAGPHTRPKLSLQTNLPITSPAALPSPDDDARLLSAIPIFVDVCTPDEPDAPDGPGWRDGAVRFDCDALSPWSVASWRSASASNSGSAASSPLGSHCGGVIRVAASPSVFGGGFLGGGGVCV
ncbi:carbon-nitrogen hydrolase [Chaetomium sp. MPI-CAGE-AT-0009]|nr:carbon-nitrogen hydrolase [Chaetomium sp. MPI-CAGE-AT-0009]